MKITLYWILSGLCLLQGLAQEVPNPPSAVLHFQNGDFLAGIPVKLDQSEMVFQSSWGQVLTVQRSAITGWSYPDAAPGSHWVLDPKTIETVSQRKEGMNAPSVWDKEGRLELTTPQYKTYTYDLPEGHRPPLEIDMKVEFPEGSPGLMLLVVPDKDQQPFKSPGIMVRISKGKLTCIPYLSSNNSRITHKDQPLPKPLNAPIRLTLTMDPDQNHFRLMLNGNDFLTWREHPDTLSDGFGFERIDWKFTGNEDVLVHHMSINVAGVPPSEEERMPPFVELTNGDHILSKSLRMDDKGIWLEIEGIPPFPLPPARASSVWTSTPEPVDSEHPPVFLNDQDARHRLSMVKQQETGESVTFRHPAIQEDIEVLKEIVHVPENVPKP